MKKRILIKVLLLYFFLLLNQWAYVHLSILINYEWTTCKNQITNIFSNATLLHVLLLINSDEYVPWQFNFYYIETGFERQVWLPQWQNSRKCLAPSILKIQHISTCQKFKRWRIREQQLGENHDIDWRVKCQWIDEWINKSQSNSTVVTVANMSCKISVHWNWWVNK